MSRALRLGLLAALLTFASAANAQTSDPPAVAPSGAPGPSWAPPPPGPDATADLALLDQRRTTSLFGRNLWRNNLAVYDHDNVGPLLIGAAATGAASFLDDDCARYFRGVRRAKWLGEMAERMGRPYIIGPLAGTLYGIGRLTHEHERFRRGSYDVAQVTLINVAYTLALKYATQRTRPDSSNHHSFPSGHTSNAFAWATIGNHYYGPWLGVPAYAFATMIGVGRMERHAHHLTDIVAGAALGYVFAHTVLRTGDDPLPTAQPSSPAISHSARERLLFRASFRF